MINGKQNVKLKSGTISFKNYFKQIPVPFKIYADFECILKKLKVILNIISIAHTQENIKTSFACFRCSFAYKVVCIDNKFSKKVNLYRGKDVVYCRRVQLS